MQVPLIFKCPDLFIPVMYTDSDMIIFVHVDANVIRSGHMHSLYRICLVVRASQYVLSAVTS